MKIYMDEENEKALELQNKNWVNRVEREESLIELSMIFNGTGYSAKLPIPVTAQYCQGVLSLSSVLETTVRKLLWDICGQAMEKSRVEFVEYGNGYDPMFGLGEK